VGREEEGSGGGREWGEMEEGVGEEGVSNLLPKVRWMREGGRLSTLLLKLSPKVRWVRVGGRLSTDLLKGSEKVSEMRDGGRLSTAWLKLCKNLRWVRDLGRWSTVWLKMLRMRWVRKGKGVAGVKLFVKVYV
jgi:hypothetical protein